MIPTISKPSEWQPIETAAKVKGRKILIFTDNPDDPIEIGSYMPDSDEPGSAGTWADSGFEASHWMPLPDAPGVQR